MAGAKTVMSFAEFRVSPRLAAVTAATRVFRTGLLLAAVATGAVDMPWNEPEPEAGTAVQAEPKGLVEEADDAEAEGDSEAEADGEEDEAELLEEPLESLEEEPQAATPVERVRARAARPVRRRVLFMVMPFG
ncbi:hypothetical protein GCM10027596_18210 [Nocardioides korecus]